MVGVSAMVIIHAKLIRILIAATTMMAVSSVPADRPAKLSPSQPVSG